MKIHFLGTNGWFDSNTGETPCILIDSKEAYVVLDAGNGIRKLDKYIKDKKKPIYLFLSHFHLDHTSGLHILLKFNFSQGLVIAGQPGTKGILGRLMAKPFTAPLQLLNRKYPVKVIDLKQGKDQLGALTFEADYLDHADPCFGYSFFIEGKKITYCTDTGVCNNLVRLAKKSDVFITECTWNKRNQYKGWPHLSPHDAAEVAKKADVKRLILTHFEASNYSNMADRREAEKKAKKIFADTVAARDDLTIKV
ncbi:MAG: MBL fold metallo-hydrolase [Candidatus Micrarchaeota archaeon]